MTPTLTEFRKNLKCRHFPKDLFPIKILVQNKKFLSQNKILIQNKFVSQIILSKENQISQNNGFPKKLVSQKIFFPIQIFFPIIKKKNPKQIWSIKLFESKKYFHSTENGVEEKMFMKTQQQLQKLS